MWFALLRSINMGVREFCWRRVLVWAIKRNLHVYQILTCEKRNNSILNSLKCLLHAHGIHSWISSYTSIHIFKNTFVQQKQQQQKNTLMRIDPTHTLHVNGYNSSSMAINVIPRRYFTIIQNRLHVLTQAQIHVEYYRRSAIWNECRKPPRKTEYSTASHN